MVNEAPERGPVEAARGSGERVRGQLNKAFERLRLYEEGRVEPADLGARDELSVLRQLRDAIAEKLEQRGILANVRKRMDRVAGKIDLDETEHDEASLKFRGELMKYVGQVQEEQERAGGNPWVIAIRLKGVDASGGEVTIKCFPQKAPPQPKRSS